MRGDERGFSVRMFAVACCAMLLVNLPHEVRGDSTGKGEPISTANLPSKDLLKSIPADYFIENAGQLSNQDVLFYSASGDMQIGFAESAVLIKMMEHKPAPVAESQKNRGHNLLNSQEPESSRGVLLRLDFEGSNKVTPQSGDPLPNPANFFIGNNPARWKTNVRSYREVVYEGLYEGVDLIYHATDEGVKYEFIVAPWTDLSAIKMSYEGADGLELGATGDLLVHTALGDVADSSPIAYQGEEDVQCSFISLKPHSYGFRCDGVDKSREVVIDPLLYSTYLGGSGVDVGYSIAVDSTGNTYMTGCSHSADFPVTPGAYDGTISGTGDVFVAKLNPTGTSLLYATYLGGSGNDDWGESIAVDSTGRAFVTGFTLSTNFPITPGAFDGTHNGGIYDAFVAKLSSTGGSLLYSTFLGGVGDDAGYSIAIDSSGNAFVTGATFSFDFPVTAGAYDTTSNGGAHDVFAAKLSSTGSSLLYSTFLGGANEDEGFSIALDSTGNAYVTGDTDSADFPTTPGSLDTAYNGGRDAFVAKLDATGSSLLYSTYLGGTDSDEANSIAVDSAGFVYVAGDTYSSSFPVTSGAFDMTYGGLHDAFVAKLNSAGSSLTYSTYIGSGGDDWIYSIRADSAGNAYVTGATNSANFPVTTGAYDAILNGSTDSFVTKLDPGGNSLLYSTYLGGASYETGHSIAIDSAGDAYVTGETSSADFPVTLGVFDTTFNVIVDLLVTKLSLVRGNTPPSATMLGVQGYVSAPGILHITDTTPDLKWTYGDTDGDPQARYDLRIGTAPGLGDMWDPPAASSSVTVVTYGGPSLVKGMDYYFAVKVNDSLSWSSEAEVIFHLNSIPNAPTTPITPAQSSIVFASPSQTVSWTTGGDYEGDNITYEWRVSIDASFMSTAAQGTTTGTVSASFVTAPSTTYYWRVRAHDDWEPMAWSAYGNSPPGYWTFSTNARPAVSGLGVQAHMSAPDILHVTNLVNPSLNWTYSDREGDPQVQYNIRVGTSSGGTDVWNPPATPGATTMVTYAGPTLNRGTDYYFGVKVDDGASWSIESEVLFHTNTIPTPPTMPTNPLNDSTIPLSASQTVTWNDGSDAEGDTLTYEWQVDDESTFMSPLVAQGTAATLSSSPFTTSIGTTYYWRVRVRDEWEPTTWSPYSNMPFGYWMFNVSPPPNTQPTMTITSPSGGEVWNQGSSHTVTWTVFDNEDASSALLVWINYTSGAGGGSVCGPVAGDGGFCDWLVPSITAADVIINGTVVDTGGLKGWDDSGRFAIQVPPNYPPTVTITSPTGGEEWFKGSSHVITWTMNDDQDVDANLTIYVNYTTGGATNQIAAALRGQRSFVWALPGIEANDVVVNITVIDSGGLKGWSQSGPFVIKAPPSPPPDFLSQYWWLLVIVVAVVIVLLLLALMKRRKPKEEKEEVPSSQPHNPPPSE